VSGDRLSVFIAFIGHSFEWITKSYFNEITKGAHGVIATLEITQGEIMSTPTESIYMQTLVAIFTAAFELGFDPYALAVQAKLDVAGYDEEAPNPVAAAAADVINESLLVAKIRCR
jgi:hypothetical protein